MPDFRKGKVHVDEVRMVFDQDGNLIKLVGNGFISIEEVIPPDPNDPDSVETYREVTRMDKRDEDLLQTLTPSQRTSIRTSASRLWAIMQGSES